MISRVSKKRQSSRMARILPKTKKMRCWSLFPGLLIPFRSIQKQSNLLHWMQNFIKIDEIMRKIVFEKSSMLHISLWMSFVGWRGGREGVIEANFTKKCLIIVYILLFFQSLIVIFCFILLFSEK